VCDHALGELDELVVHLAVGAPHPGASHEPPLAAADAERERLERENGAQGSALEQDLSGHAASFRRPQPLGCEKRVKPRLHSLVTRGFPAGNESCPFAGESQDMETNVSRADLHCHSTASELSRLGVQRSLGLPECATPPDEVYELAKRRGMDFVTITDHDTIDGVMELAARPDVFVSEELTAWFRGEQQAVHVLCYGIAPADHEWLQRHASDVEACADYLHGNGIACALAHPFYAVAAPLTARHRRRLAQLFPVWETRNGSRAKELNLPAAIYIETHGGTGVGGSDDHAGIDIGRTFTETPAAASPAEFLAHLGAGDAAGRGAQGSAAKWAHSAMALAVRALGRGDGGAAPHPGAVLEMALRVMREGEVRQGVAAADLGPDDARSLLRAWLDSLSLNLDERGLLAWMQSDDFSHTDLFRRARRVHERRLREAVGRAVAIAHSHGDYGVAALDLFQACVPAIPYAPATAFLGREKGKLARVDAEPRRVAIVADGIGGMHGVTHTLDEIRERGVPGFEVEVIGTDADVDRRLPAVAEVDIPFYAGLRIGVPSLPAAVEALADGRYDAVHVTAPGPTGIAATVIARGMEIPVVASYHTELGVYAGLRSGDARLREKVDAALAAFYGAATTVLSPSASADDSVRALGVPPERIGRWDRGVDLSRFSPNRRRTGAFPGRLAVLYAGRLTKEKGVDLLAEAFLTARADDPRLHLVLAGGGPEEDALRERLGDSATFLGWLEGDELAWAYASADMFCFASRTDTFGQVVLEAQASGLPVVAVDEGGPATLIEHTRSGLLCAPDPRSLADALVTLGASPVLRDRLAQGGLAAVAGRSWEASLDLLAGGYRRALAQQAVAVVAAA
jgi:glycosyltransferase involved in cell wall biosynthesis/predicted metal-dependent phosphoesterase TrpH